jgi:sugar/nucleoside kinase (ribokinase family)
MSAPPTPQRLLLLGSVLVDVVMFVPELPSSGGDILATDSLIATGGGFNVLTAAQRQGLPAAYFGLHGHGTFGSIARRDLEAEGIDVLLPMSARGDTGFCIGLVDETGERTYATRPGVEGRMTQSELSRFDPRSTDVVYLSGYELLYEHATLIGECFAAIPSDVLTVFDPGPIVGDIPADLLELALTRANWTSLNRAEAEVVTGASGAQKAATSWSKTAGSHRNVVVRDGASGCWVVTHVGRPDEEVEQVAVPLLPASAVDTSGAGDCHVGAFVAALARGHTPGVAGLWANAAAARAVARKGPATSPTLLETRADLRLVSAEVG